MVCFRVAILVEVAIAVAELAAVIADYSDLPLVVVSRQSPLSHLDFLLQQKDLAINESRDNSRPKVFLETLEAIQSLDR